MNSSNLQKNLNTVSSEAGAQGAAVHEEAISLPSAEMLESELKRCEHKHRYNKTLLSTVAVLIVVAAVAILISMLWMPVLHIYGSSMSPTLKEGQLIVAVKGSDYKAGDLVAFYYGNKILIKRVIAGPNDWIEIEDDGDVLVNGTMLDEPYITKKALGECDQEFPLQIGEDRWFLMGDNRSVSIDSRSTSVGLVSSEQIIGKIALRVWPLKNFGIVN